MSATKMRKSYDPDVVQDALILLALFMSITDEDTMDEDFKKKVSDTMDGLIKML